MDTKLFEYEKTFGTGLGMSKAERLQTGESAMTHAMGTQHFFTPLLRFLKCLAN